MIPAYTGHGFARRSYNGPANPENRYWRVTLTSNGRDKTGSVEGTLTLKYDRYKRIRRRRLEHGIRTTACSPTNSLSEAILRRSTSSRLGSAATV